MSRTWKVSAWSRAVFFSLLKGIWTFFCWLQRHILVICVIFFVAVRNKMKEAASSECCSAVGLLFKLEQKHKQAMRSRDRCNLTHTHTLSVGFSTHFSESVKLFYTEIINKKLVPQSKPPVSFPSIDSSLVLMCYLNPAGWKNLLRMTSWMCCNEAARAAGKRSGKALRQAGFEPQTLSYNAGYKATNPFCTVQFVPEIFDYSL